MAKIKKDIKEDPLEKTLWAAADKLRKNMDAAEYKHIVLGLIFLKYISDAFDEVYKPFCKVNGKDFEKDKTLLGEFKDECLADNVFYVPAQARWSFLLAQAKQPTIGKIVDEAMDSIEAQNPTLKGVLPKQYARPNLDKNSLGGLIDMIGNIALGDKASQSKDLLGKVYEYFLGQFALAEGKKGGQFYTPASIVKLLVEMLEPYTGRVYDPCCGSGGMFVQSEKFVLARQGKIDDISIYGQESNQTTYRLARMNLAIRGIDSSNIKWNNEGSFLKDAHPDLKADYIIANPPFNDSDWSGDLLTKDGRWKYGVPPKSNANFAWMQHFIYHLSPSGTAGIVLADSSMTTKSGEESEIKKRIIDEGIIDCMVALPSHLFSNTQITACLWFLARNKTNEKFRNRKDDILFIDASKLGTMVTRKSKILTTDDVKKISETYHNWRNPNGKYKNVSSFCKSVSVKEVKDSNYILAPNSYIDTTEQKLSSDIDFKKSNELDELISVKSKIDKSILNIKNSWGPSSFIKIQDIRNAINLSHKLQDLTNSLYLALIKKYFLNTDKNKLSPKDWKTKEFGELFTERNTKVEQLGYCPPIYSVTNGGIQLREDKYSKELSKDTSNYKVAYCGDMIFGLSREIPNLDVLKDNIGAFSNAYSIFQPIDKRIGLIIGGIMRLKLSEQTDILKGGAREGRGLDKDKLMKKKFNIPSTSLLDKIWGTFEQ